MAKGTDTSIEELTLSIGLLVRKVRTAAPDDLHDLSWTQRAVMARLDRGGPSTVAELARAEAVKPQSMGTAVAALEVLGLIERTPHPTDGRQLNVRLSRKGAALRRQQQDAKRDWLTQAIRKLDKTDQETLFAAGEIIRKLVEQ